MNTATWDSRLKVNRYVFNRIENAISDYVERYPSEVASYRENVPPDRFRWDILWAATVANDDLRREIASFPDKAVDTVLRRVLP